MGTRRARRLLRVAGRRGPVRPRRPSRLRPWLRSRCRINMPPSRAPIHRRRFRLRSTEPMRSRLAVGCCRVRLRMRRTKRPKFRPELRVCGPRSKLLPLTRASPAKPTPKVFGRAYHPIRLHHQSRGLVRLVTCNIPCHQQSAPPWLLRSLQSFLRSAATRSRRLVFRRRKRIQSRGRTRPWPGRSTVGVRQREACLGLHSQGSHRGLCRPGTRG